MTSPTKKTVLVTGVNGYIASHIALQLARLGHTVRGTSRSPSSEHLLRDLFTSNGIPSNQYQHRVVPSITEPGAFDQAVAGAHSIIHVASPVDFTLPDLDSFLIPAVQGVESILGSALSHAGPQLESFVLTSSIAAIVDRWKHPPPTTYAYSEADWNDNSLRVARENFAGPVAYGASKTEAERALWAFRDEHHPPFAIAAINPGVATGPPVLWPDHPSKLNETLKPVWSIYAGLATEIPPQIGMAAYIDVRDVAALHVWAALHPRRSAGRRYLATNGKAPPQAIADLLRERFPERDILVGAPGEGYVAGTYQFLDGEASAVATKAYAALGVESFILFDRSVMDTVAGFEARWPGMAGSSRL